jgi:hypothetical protein
MFAASSERRLFDTGKPATIFLFLNTENPENQYFPSSDYLLECRGRFAGATCNY